MKRVQSACILQTLVFSQKDDSYFSKEKAIALNKKEVEKYKASLDKNKTRFQITEESEQADGSIIVRVRKQYNGKTDVSEYFNQKNSRPYSFSGEITAVYTNIFTVLLNEDDPKKSYAFQYVDLITHNISIKELGTIGM